VEHAGRARRKIDYRRSDPGVVTFRIAEQERLNLVLDGIQHIVWPRPSARPEQIVQVAQDLILDPRCPSAASCA